MTLNLFVFDENGNELDDIYKEEQNQEQNEPNETPEIQKARQFANDLINGKYTTQDFLAGAFNDKLEWLEPLEMADKELLNKAFKAIADLA